MEGDVPMPSLARQLAEYAAALTFEQLPDETVHQVKRRLLDTLACAWGGWDSDVGRIARAGALKCDRGRSTLLGLPDRASPLVATFANGSLVHHLAFNDTYLSLEPAHPSDNIAACLAVAEAVGASGRELVTAIALAYEVQCRFCDAAALRRRGWDHVTYLAFSTALAAGKLMGLEAEQLAHAVSIAAVQSAALRQTRIGQLSHWKSCAAANATRAALFAADAAGWGLTGPEEIFEGGVGFAAQISGPFDPDVPAWGAPSMVCRTSLKKWPGAYHAQSAIEAAIWIHDEVGHGALYEGVRIVSFDAAVEIAGSEPAKWKPATRETADQSLPYLVAAALLDGELGAAQFAEPRLQAPDVAALLQKVRIQRDPGLTARYPEAVANRVEVSLQGGRVLAREIVYPSGHPRNPLTDIQLEEKLRAAAAPHLDAAALDALISVLWRIEDRSAAEILELSVRSAGALSHRG